MRRGVMGSEGSQKTLWPCIKIVIVLEIHVLEFCIQNAS